VAGVAHGIDQQGAGTVWTNDGNWWHQIAHIWIALAGTVRNNGRRKRTTLEPKAE
jgi:hypothetical protein